jgi:RHS repeat-associated protein
MTGEKYRFGANKYRYGFNGKEKDTESFEGAYDFGARILDARLGRWLSVDPLYEKSISYSVFHFAACSPILYIDPNGRENIIYIVVTPDGRKQLKKDGLTAEQIAKQATEFYSGMHLKTVVKVFEGESQDFDINAIDKTDAVVVIGGSAKDNKSYVKDVLGSTFSNQLSDIDDATNPEKSENDPVSNPNTDFECGNIITLNAKVLKESVFNKLLFRKDEDKSKNSETMTKVAAYFIMHGAGHNMGYGHSDDAWREVGKNTREPMMNSGTQCQPYFGAYPLRDNLEKYVSFELNPKYVSAMIRRFHAHLEAKDNYQKNKEKSGNK